LKTEESTMAAHLDWIEIAIRLGLTILAGALIGLDRGEHGRPAGLRTTLLVCLAASISMIQANLLLATSGRHPDSFIMLDLMRLPLGILTGMGFIGAGAILKKGDIVLGVTTAATLWFVTVIGLCFGGGQLGLGMASLVIGLLILRGLKLLEGVLPQDRRATLVVTAALNGMSAETLRTELSGHGFQLVSSAVRYDRDARNWTLSSEVQWRARPTDPPVPAVVQELAEQEGVSELQWCPAGRAIGVPI
jgi:putative Mg2+ transporter-C (MgtC) family protein